MGNNAWENNDLDNDANNPNNWSETRVPTTGDTAYFKLTDDDCTLSGNISCDAVTLETQYGGILDLNGNNLSTTGDMTFSGGGTVDCGEGTITCSGNFDNKGQTTWTQGTSTVVLDGTAQQLISGSTKDLYNLTISGSITLSSLTDTYLDVQGLLSVPGSFTLSDTCVVRNSLNLTGTLDGSGKLWLINGSIITQSGTFSPATVEANGTLSIAAGTYGGTWLIDRGGGGGSRTFTINGNVVFSGNVTFTNGEASVGRTFVVDPQGFSVEIQGDASFTTTGTETLTIDCTGDPDWEFQADLGLTEVTADTLIWNKGAGTISFTTTGGTQQYTDTTNGIQNLGDVTHNGSGGTLQLATEMECDDFNGTAGTFDINGAHTLDVAGNLDWASGYLFADPAGGTFHVQGNFTANANDLSGATAAWYLQVHGTAVASGVGDVAYSDARTTGHTEIDASAGPWTDSGNNYNWSFGAAPTFGGVSTILGGGIPA